MNPYTWAGLFLIGCAGIVWWLCRPERDHLQERLAQAQAFEAHTRQALELAERSADFVLWEQEARSR